MKIKKYFVSRLVAFIRYKKMTRVRANQANRTDFKKSNTVVKTIFIVIT